jgi:pimeloyl-ACP methyl ester carboxylesterase
MMPVRFRSTDGVELAGRFLQPNQAVGTAAAVCVVVVPGGMPMDYSAGGAWAALAQILVACGAQVLMYDGRGFGLSQGLRLHQDDSRRDLRAAVSWLDGSQARPASEIALLGHSVGGAAAIQLALEEPRVSAICCYGTLPSYSAAQRAGALDRALQRYWKKAGGAGSFEDFVQEYSSVDPIALGGELTCRILLAGGTDDPSFFSVEAQLELLSRMGGAKARGLLAMEGWPHTPSPMDPAFPGFAWAVAGWLIGGLALPASQRPTDCSDS